MIVAELERQAYFDDGTWGELRVFGNGRDEDPTFECHTVECPWAGNMRNVSCIPEGIYSIAPRRFIRGGYDTWEVRNVAGRTHILFHKGNFPTHVKGCVALGRGRDCIGGRIGIRNSGDTLMEFLDEVPKAISAAGTEHPQVRIYQRVAMAQLPPAG